MCSSVNHPPERFVKLSKLRVKYVTEHHAVRSIAVDVGILFCSQLRYQKCLDAHPQGLNPSMSLSHNINSPNVNGISRKGISSTLKSLVGTITGRKMKLTQS